MSDKNNLNKQPEFKGIFQLNVGSENFKNLLRSFLLTKPLYIATLMYKTLKEYDTHSFLEIVSTQKLEELKLSLKLMAVLYPKFKGIKFLNFETVKVDFNKFSKNQKEFDAKKLKQFLNWRLDMNCIEKPLIEKPKFVEWIYNSTKNFLYNKCIENPPNLNDYIEIVENKNKRNEFLIFRLKCLLEKIEEKSSSNNDKRMLTDKLIKILILSNFVGENVTDKMKPEEKNKLVETINKTNFNLTGWNDKIFKYSLKLLLNLGIYLY
ncbi:unnamed protein product [Meloidogyne enterolobii]|uniref:Uncharacterized protein n=1 Tax=Meloidogyne enterolobii TaxID=390850 RepID=A0ACB0YVG2_MELEN